MEVILLIVVIQEMLGQWDDIIFPLPQRRNMDRYDIQPVIQIFPKALLPHHLLQVAVGGGDDPDIHLH